MSCNCCKYFASFLLAAVAAVGLVRLAQRAASADERSSANAATSKSTERPSTSSADEKLPIDPAASQIRPGDWNQWGGSSVRNNTPDGKNIPTDWRPGEFDDDTGAWKHTGSKNIKWVARLGTKSNGNAVVANGKVYMGTNNGGGYLKRYPSSVDLGVLLCFNEADGKFLWQDSSEKLPTGRVNDWPLEGICSVPLVEGHRLWYVTSRGEVKCLDTDERKAGTTDEPKVIWVLDMMKKLGVQQHNMCSCGITSAGDLLFVNTSNGIDVDHSYIPSPNAPSFICLDKNTGKVYWADNSPGKNILHGQWSSPSYAVLGGVPQVIFGGGDGWLYDFQGTKESENGRPKLLWKFDCNPKTAKYSVGGQSTRNHIIGSPVIYKGLVYVGVGEDPEHAEGIGNYWCIDPTKRGDVSSELVFNSKDLQHPLPPRRLQAAIKEQGDLVRENPNSAMVWHYDHYDLNHDGKIEDPIEVMHRTCGTAAIKNDLLFIPDFSGILHCLDAKTGKPHWTYDLLSACWGSCLIVEDKVYVGNEDGDVFIFRLSPKMEIISKTADGKPGGIEMGSAVYSTPIVAHNVLYISNRNYLFAITNSPQVAAAK
ncbi:MAG TPA: PQQ-binding-like beta-propeller repeat protein [Pirellulales bacterium]|nr:PQQ-binding-like beta-propeller repeat protein [Pirellulales bacterium]